MKPFLGKASFEPHCWSCTLYFIGFTLYFRNSSSDFLIRSCAISRRFLSAISSFLLIWEKLPKAMTSHGLSQSQIRE